MINSFPMASLFHNLEMQMIFSRDDNDYRLSPTTFFLLFHAQAQRWDGTWWGGCVRRWREDDKPILSIPLYWIFFLSNWFSSSNMHCKTLKVKIIDFCRYNLQEMFLSSTFHVLSLFFIPLPHVFSFKNITPSSVIAKFAFLFFSLTKSAHPAFAHFSLVSNPSKNFLRSCFFLLAPCQNRDWISFLWFFASAILHNFHLPRASSRFVFLAVHLF